MHPLFYDVYQSLNQHKMLDDLFSEKICGGCLLQSFQLIFLVTKLKTPHLKCKLVALGVTYNI